MSPEAQARDEEYRVLIKDGLARLKRDYDGPFCAERVCVEDFGRRGRKRKRKRGRKGMADDGDGDGGGRMEGGESTALKGEGRGEQVGVRNEPQLKAIASSSFALELEGSLSPLVLPLDSEVDTISSIDDIYNRPVTNASLTTSATLKINDISTSPQHSSAAAANFSIPPRSTFCLYHLESKSAASVLTSLAEATASRRFDLVVLDPPWPNRSVRRRQAYSTSENTSTDEANDPFSTIVPILAPLLAPNGRVAVWLTHRETVRAQALAALESWGMEVVEEWVWAKITSRGELVYDVEGTWRKGWEVLLVGRKRAAREKGAEISRPAEEEKVKRRLICAVPDVHSRKPCLKKVFEEWLELADGDCMTLEVFARSLVEGWCSIGDEVLKFQWEGWWMHEQEQPHE